jgi:hypothetical protein
MRFSRSNMDSVHYTIWGSVEVTLGWIKLLILSLLLVMTSLIFVNSVKFNSETNMTLKSHVMGVWCSWKWEVLVRLRNKHLSHPIHVLSQSGPELTFAWLALPTRYKEAEAPASISQIPSSSVVRPLHLLRFVYLSHLCTQHLRQ